MSTRTSFLFLLLGTAAWAQSQRLDPRSTMHITFPEDSPVTVVSADWGESNASPRGGAMLLDLHTSLSLRNSGSRRIRGITLLVSAQEVTPGGKASVSVPSLNAVPARISRSASISACCGRCKPAMDRWSRSASMAFCSTICRSYGPNRLELPPVNDCMGDGSAARPAVSSSRS